MEKYKKFLKSYDGILSYQPNQHSQSGLAGRIRCAGLAGLLSIKKNLDNIYPAEQRHAVLIGLTSMYLPSNLDLGVSGLPVSVNGCDGKRPNVYTKVTYYKDRYLRINPAVGIKCR